MVIDSCRASVPQHSAATRGYRILCTGTLPRRCPQSRSRPDAVRTGTSHWNSKRAIERHRQVTDHAIPGHCHVVGCRSTLLLATSTMGRVRPSEARGTRSASLLSAAETTPVPQQIGQDRIDRKIIPIRFRLRVTAQPAVVSARTSFAGSFPIVAKCDRAGPDSPLFCLAERQTHQWSVPPLARR